MRPKPSSAERLVGELDAGEALALPGAVAQRALGGADVAREREHQRDRVLGGRDDVGLGRVADDDARRGRRVDVDVVDADAGAADHAQARARDAISSASTCVAERTTSASRAGQSRR